MTKTGPESDLHSVDMRVSITARSLEDGGTTAGLRWAARSAWRLFGKQTLRIAEDA